MMGLGRPGAVIASAANQSRSRRALRPLDRRVAIARPEGRASLDALWLLAMTVQATSLMRFSRPAARRDAERSRPPASAPSESQRLARRADRYSAAGSDRKTRSRRRRQ